MSHGSTAKAVRLRKEAHPEWYCRESRCLWFTGSPERPGTPCKKHPRFVSKYAQQFEGALAILEQEQKEKKCTCMCHTPGVVMMHVVACC